MEVAVAAVNVDVVPFDGDDISNDGKINDGPFAFIGYTSPSILRVFYRCHFTVPSLKF